MNQFLEFLLWVLLRIVPVALAGGWIFLLFRLGQKGDNTVLFYVLLYAPWVLVLLAFVALANSVSGLLSLVGWNPLLILLVAVFIMERGFWGYTLKEIAGEDELVKFYLVYPIPLLGWMVYWGVRIR